MIIYITGKSGSGKSTYAKRLASELNYKYIDIDRIGHKIYENSEIMEKVYHLFGDCIKDENGNFDRKKLGKIIFSEGNSEKVKQFNELTWEHMQKLIDLEMVDNLVMDWFLLPNTKYWAKSAIRILVKSFDDELRLEKIIKRDNICKEYAKLRDNSGISYNENEFDFVFANDYNEEKLAENVKTIVDYINSAKTLTVLGTQSPFATENKACPSFMLSDGQNNLLLDCGSGSHRFFDINKLDNLGIVISHLHRDHYNDLYNYMYSSLVMKNQNRVTKPINILLPKEPSHIFEDIKSEKLTFSVVEAIKSDKKHKFCGFELDFLKTIHSDDVLSYAIKVKINDKIVVYSGDCSYKSKQDLVEFARNADILICESSFLVEYGFDDICNHLTAQQAGKIAKEANVKKLILNHFWPEEDVLNYYNEARKEFLNVFVADEKDIYLI